jgi:predicted thioesterase
VISQYATFNFITFNPNWSTMDLSQLFKPGMSREESFLIEEEHSAIHVGSGSLRVLATPWMIAFMENTARRLMAERLPDGYSSVGAHVDVRHLAPTPVGRRLRVRTEVIAVDGIKVTFAVAAWDDIEQVGEGQHLRVIIDEARFLKRVADKIENRE